MNKRPRAGLSRRLLASTALGVALTAGVVTAGMPASAAQPTTPANHSHPGTLPKLGARKTPFSPKTTTSATTAKGMTPADIADEPWLVGIMVNIGIGSNNTCAGTIISPTKVLTSARCDTEQSHADVEVIAGRDNLFDDSVGFVDGVASVWTDPNFTSDADNVNLGSNVQVLTLTQPLPSVYTPIGLSTQGDESPYSIGSSLTTYGYQWTNNEGPNYPYLVKAPVTVQAGSACQAVNSHYPANGEACGGFSDGVQRDLSAFNMGSPLVASNGKQVGVADALYFGMTTQTAFERLSVEHNAITADLNRSNPNNADWTEDGNSDVVGENYLGQLTVYEGYGASPAINPGFSAQSNVDSYDWDTLNYKVLRANNFDGTGDHGLLAVEHDGVLLYYPVDQFGSIEYNQSQTVGTGWNRFSNIIPINNFTGDGKLALIGETPDGVLHLYEHGASGWVSGTGVQIGNGFDQFTNLMSLQWTSNGHVGLLGVTRNGDLAYYGVDAHGNWTNAGGTSIGVGFGGLRTVFSVGSFGGSDTGSIMTVTSNGMLRVYQADGNGGWVNGNGARIGVGFQTVEALF